MAGVVAVGHGLFNNIEIILANDSPQYFIFLMDKDDISMGMTTVSISSQRVNHETYAF
jgi:hypothetical protein